MNKRYQKSVSGVLATPELAIPEHVSVAMNDIAAEMKEGLQVMSSLMEADVSALVGVKGRHDAGRIAVRRGHEKGSVTLGGRRVAVSRPRVRAVDGSGELAVASYDLFSSTEILGRMALEQMLAGSRRGTTPAPWSQSAPRG